MTIADQKLSTIGQKIKRAKKHLSDLEAERDRFFANDAYEVESYKDPQTGDRIFKMLYVKMGEPLKTGDTFLVLPKEYKNVEFAFDIGISEPSIIGNIPVIFWLGNAIYKVERLIQSFKPDFK